jgi:Mn2+/Fe2+ NRAMP family transporter
MRPKSGGDGEPSNARHSWRQYLRAIGPGLISGACADDPSGIATYAQAGSQFGLSFLWSALFTFPLIAAIREICDRTALAAGTGLEELAIKRFHRTGRGMVGIILSVLIVANTLTIAADLVAIGSGMNLLKAEPTWIWALLSGVAISVLLIKGSFDRIAQVFKVLAGTLVVYVIVMVSVTHDWLKILQYGVVPHIQLNKSYISLLVALLGTTISPYIFF